MLFTVSFVTLLFSCYVRASLLYVSSYAGTVTTLNFTHGAASCDLKNISTINSCGPDPSWLTWEPVNRNLYCSGEQTIAGNGSLTVLSSDANGTLTEMTKELTLNGGVNSVLYGKGNGTGNASFIAVAHYGGSALSTYNLTSPLTPVLLQTLPFTLDHKGNGSQASPHPHQVVLDPTSRFVVSPDLGADKVRVFRIEGNTGLLRSCPDLSVPAGSGPRHAAFWAPPKSAKASHQPLGKVAGKPCHGTAGKMVINNVHDPRRRAMTKATAGNTCTGNSRVVMYVVSELANTVAGYEVTYTPEGCMSFKGIQTSPTYDKVPKVAAAGEIAVIDNFITVSNRNDSFYPIPNGPALGTSDSLSVFTIHPNGTFSSIQRSPAYGSFPRQFSVNKQGDMIAVALQKNGTVAIIERDLKTGKLGNKLADVFVGGNVTSVVWDD